jgi:16S rRNA (guanine966-N2)-methyltransferase
VRQKPRQTNQVRIIGGALRGRKLRFADAPGLRPTGERVRETLFNWLQPFIAGARCLDAFAGSGALAMEAASRGAGRVVLVERERKIAAQLRENLRLLSLNQAEVIQADALSWLSDCQETFDLVFLDPPFADQRLGNALALLIEGGIVCEGGLVYLENDGKAGLPALPEVMVWEKRKQAGQVAFGLARLAAG